jgi:signal transduction histidine kinase
MQASMLRMRFGNGNPGLADHVNAMIRLVDDNIQVVRNISAALRPAMLDLGIATALEWLGQEFVEKSGIPCEVRVMEQAGDMDERCATTLFRIVQESLNNVMRHAEAGRVVILLIRTGTHYRLKVTDDGKGFEPDRIPKKSLGLVGMRERVLMLDGDIRIASEPGRGTMLEVDIPVCRITTEQ